MLEADKEVQKKHLTKINNRYHICVAGRIILPRRIAEQRHDIHTYE